MPLRNYLVTLGVRPAELSGLKELPSLTKDQLTPLVLLAPWLATTPLSRALEKFEESYSGRRYFVDVDTYYRFEPDKTNEAKEALARLQERPADLDTWFDLLSDFPNANPCLLMAGQSLDAVRRQINWAREHSRNFCVRINLAANIGSGTPRWLGELLAGLIAEGINDYAIVLEFGLLRDALLAEAVVVEHLQGALSGIPHQVPIAVSCTSFPRDFTVFDGLAHEGFSNRVLLNNVRRATNLPNLVYGDWGTTKPRSYERASRPKIRIDYPVDEAWIIARNQDPADEITFTVAARRIVDSEYWYGELGIWGEQLIESTADGQPFAIETMPKMYAARINIHLHRQAFFEHLPLPAELDEEWNEDDF